MLEIKFSIEACGGDTGTDAWVIQTAKEGIPTSLFSVPLKYMHTPNEVLNIDDAKALVANGVIAVAEGANMPTTLEATHYLQENGVIFAPGKASNAGGVATSALEMSQNSERLSWSFEEVDAKLQTIMVNICHNMANAAEKAAKEAEAAKALEEQNKPETKVTKKKK